MCLRVCQAATKKQKYEKISEKKMSTPVEVLCKVRTCSTGTVVKVTYLHVHTTHLYECMFPGFPCRVCHVSELLPRLALRGGSRLHVPAPIVPHPLQVNTHTHTEGKRPYFVACFDTSADLGLSSVLIMTRLT